MGKPFEVKSAAGETLQIPAGEYYFNTKPRGRRMMRNSLSGDARRVYACLELATMGFRQELAVTMERGNQRPLTPSDIARETGFSKQNVRRALQELEYAGLAERRADDGSGLRHGHVQIYSWAVPHDPKPKDSSRARLLPAWFPVSWEPLKPVISRFKLTLIEDEVVARRYIEEGEQLARDYKKAEEVALRFLESVSARRRSNKEEITERKIEKKSGGRASVAETEIGDVPAGPPQSDLLEEGLQRRGFGPIEDAFLAKIRVALGAVPLQWFFEILDERTTRGRITYALLPKIAEKAAELWLKNERNRRGEAERAERERSAAEARMAEYAKEDARRVLADPFATAEAIVHARMVEPHWQPTPDVQRELFDQRVTKPLTDTSAVHQVSARNALRFWSARTTWIQIAFASCGPNTCVARVSLMANDCVGRGTGYVASA